MNGTQLKVVVQNDMSDTVSDWLYEQSYVFSVVEPWTERGTLIVTLQNVSESRVEKVLGLIRQQPNVLLAFRAD